MNGTTEPPATKGARTENAGSETDPGPPSLSTILRCQVRFLVLKKGKLVTLVAIAIALSMGVVLRVAPPRDFSLFDFVGSPFPYLLAVPLALLWAMSVWSDEGPGDRAYHWSLPVRRPVHDLTRVGAGGLLFLATAALELCVLYGAYLIFGGDFALGHPALAGLFLGVVAVAYLLGTIPALVADHPLRWTIGTVLGYLILGGLLEEGAGRWGWLAEPEAAVKSVWNGSYGLENALLAPNFLFVSRRVEEFSPELGQAGGALLVWLCLSVSAVAALSFLHLERAKGAGE